MAQINKPSEYFNTKLYTGNGSTQSITGVGFQPDWVWIKGRSVASGGNLSDSVRGVNKQLQSAQNFAEETLTTCLTSFDSDGFSLGSNGGVNQNSGTYVAWNWLGGGTASSNTDGSITSNVSANTTSGFSIVSYTGTGATGTIGHGLNSAPSCIITKSTSAAEDWGMYHVGIGNTSNISLNLTNAKYSANSAFWNNTNPTSSVFTVGTHPTINYNTQTMIAYCFAEKKGFSKFGDYAPNGSADGNFIYLGFSPAFFLVKNTNTTRNWLIFDNKRNTSNEITKSLEPNTSDAEQTDTNLKVDFLSNGVKLRGLGGDLNTGDGVQYIYMAFAENPLVGTNNTPATAR